MLLIFQLDVEQINEQLKSQPNAVKDWEEQIKGIEV